jgi:hypothetical protein
MCGVLELNGLDFPNIQQSLLHLLATKLLKMYGVLELASLDFLQQSAKPPPSTSNKATGNVRRS